MGIFGGGGFNPIKAVVNIGKSIVSAVVNIASAVVNTAMSIVTSLIIAKPAIPDLGNQGIDNASTALGNRLQVSPAANNKLPIVYGTAWLGGTVIDLSITNNNQTMYFALAISEVTNTESGGTPDTFTFGSVYWGGKRCVFDAVDQTKVIKLIDESTNAEDTAVSGNLFMYFYKNGSSNPTNTTQSAISVMSDVNLIYKWNSTKLMTNCVFAIIKLNYNSAAGITSLQQTKFQITNSRSNPADCLSDYWQSTRYGAAIPANQIDAESLDELRTYCNESMTFTTFEGTTSTIQRFKFDGLLDTSKTIQSNMQIMADCCDCLIRYNEITAKWGVITQKPTVIPVMNINDSNMVSAITITPVETSSTYNIAEVYFADNKNQDAFSSATFDLAEINPSLLYQNEPINKQNVTLSLVNNNVRAQYLATRFLENSREDLQVSVTIMFVGLQLEAGDIVTVTNYKYGWDEKLFRLNQVVENFATDGAITVDLNMSEFNPLVFDDKNITEFTPAPNTGIGDPTTFGTIPAPEVISSTPNGVAPSVTLAISASSAGVSQYAEVWYSAFPNPTSEQRIFAGTTAIQSSGTPYEPNLLMGNVTISNLPAGNWYFFDRMVNILSSSSFSPASAVFDWRPLTFQYEQRYLSVAYATSITGDGFSFSPRNKTYFGLLNVASANPVSDPADYVWNLASPAFGATIDDNVLLFVSRNNRKYSFDVGNAAYSGIGGAYVPTETSIYDTSQWSGLEDGFNIIDLDARTGQLIKIGTSSISSADGLLSVANNTEGTMVVSLQKFLNFGNGVYSKAFTPAQLTIDVYGRVVGFLEQDEFYYTEVTYLATASQTSFSSVHIVNQCLVFRNGVLLSINDYSETSTTVVLNNACVAGELITIVSMRVNSNADFYAPLVITIASSTSNTITYTGLPYQSIVAGDKIAFSADGETFSAVYIVSSINLTTKIITFTTTIADATAGKQLYEYRAAGTSYPPFTRYEHDVIDISTFTPTTYALNSGYEQIYVNGSAFNEIDYDLTGDVLSGFPANITGKLIIIIYEANNLGIPCSNVTNTVAYSVNGALTYVFDSNPLSMAVYANGAYLIQGASYDFTASAVSYNLTTAFNNNFTLLNQQTFARIGAA